MNKREIGKMKKKPKIDKNLEDLKYGAFIFCRDCKNSTLHDVYLNKLTNKLKYICLSCGNADSMDFI